MRSILDQLDSDQAVLLLYLAGELPSADRVAVDRRLLLDEQLRAQLESLRASHEQITRMLDEVDATQPIPGSAVSSQRVVSRVLKQWQAEQSMRIGRTRIEPTPRSKWIWIGPAAAAAVLLIGWGVWWGMQPDKYATVADASTDTAAITDGAADDNGTDQVADTAMDLDLSFDHSTAYASMQSNVDDLKILFDIIHMR